MNDGSVKPGLLSQVVFALMGEPDVRLAPEDLEAREKRRRNAGQQAAAAANSGDGNADSYMQAPGAGGSGFGLNDIIKLLGSGSASG